MTQGKNLKDHRYLGRVHLYASRQHSTFIIISGVIELEKILLKFYTINKEAFSEMATGPLIGKHGSIIITCVKHHRVTVLTFELQINSLIYVYYICTQIMEQESCVQNSWIIYFSCHRPLVSWQPLFFSQLPSFWEPLSFYHFLSSSQLLAERRTQPCDFSRLAPDILVCVWKIW